MGDIRDNFPALVHGSYELISNNNNLTLFKRETSDETLYVALNNDDESQVVEIDGLSDDYQLNGLMHDHLVRVNEDRKSTRLNSSHVAISYAVFCLKKTK